jgi:hypothetical protein
VSAVAETGRTVIARAAFFCAGGGAEPDLALMKWLILEGGS